MKKYIIYSGCILSIFGILHSCMSQSHKNNKEENYNNSSDYVSIVCNTDSAKIQATSTQRDSISLHLSLLTEEIKRLFDTESEVYENKKNITYVKPPYKISKHGIKFIKKFESCSLKKYRYKRKNGTYEKYYTVGWGHVLYPGDKYYNRNSITQAEADQLFIEDTKWLNQSCNNLISELSPHFKPTQGFVDGLCSLIYNCGEQGIRNSKFFNALKRCRYYKDDKTNIYYINKQDYMYCLSLVKCTKLFEPGHKPRRKAESKLMAQK